MGPSLAGRGKPRPLLAGVFRKACDYCVRSKRGCNGGTPCEQCIRRGQSCTYSQRRKSGPRGRPLRPQHAISAPSPSVIGTRTSARRASKRLSSPGNKAPPSPSPSRTASMSSSSSDFSDEDTFSEDSSSTSDMEEAELEHQHQQQKQKQKLHAHKKTKISGQETVTGGHRGSSSPLPPPPPPVSRRGDQGHRSTPPAASPSPFVAKQAAGSRTATTRQTAAEDEEEEDGTTQAATEATAASLSFLNEPASYLSKNMMSSADRAVPPRQHSPLTVGAPALNVQLQRSSSLPTWARETSTDAEQRRQQVHRSSASVGAVPTSSSSKGEAIHEIAMQPWEDTRLRPVTLVNMAAQRQQQQQQEQDEAMEHQAPAFAVASSSSSSSSRIFASRHSAQQSLPTIDPMDVSRKQEPAQTATLAASMMMVGEGAADGDFAGAALEDLEEEDDFAHCPWRIPSLTREQSLARVVAALGAEQGSSAQQGIGVGFEGSYVTAW
eukprot:g10842.t1